MAQHPLRAAAIRQASALVIVSTLAACASVPTHFQVEGRVALRAVELQRGVQAVLEATDTAFDAGLVSRPTARQIATVGRRVGLEGQRLAIVLSEIDRAREPFESGLAFGRAQIIVQGIQAALTEMPEEVPVGVQAALTSVAAIVTVLATEVGL